MKTKLLLSCIAYLLFSNQIFAQGWETTFPPDSIFLGGGFTMGFKVESSLDGGYIVAGEVDFPTGAIRHNMRLAKTDAFGNIEWDTTYGAGNIINQEVKLLYEQPDGKILVGGNLNGAPFLNQYNSSGEILWEKQFLSDTSRFIYEGIVDLNGDIVLTGWTNLSFSVPSQLYLAKLSQNGDLLWEKYQEFSAPAIANGIDATQDGGYIIVGRLDNNLNIFKFDSDGNFQWDQGYTFSNSDEGFTIKNTPDNGYIIGGTSLGISNFLPLVFKTDSLGNGEWTKILGNGLVDKINDIILTPDGGYGVVGSLFFFWSLGSDGYVAKLDNIGEIEWSQNFAASDKSIAAIRNTPDGGLVITGGSFDGMLLKKIGGTVTSTNELDYNFNLNIFPNPSNDYVTFKIDNFKTSTKYLHIFNSVGKKIEEGIFKNNTFIFNGGRYPAGVYFFQIKNENRLLESGKIIISR